MAIRTLHQVATDEGNEFPKAAKIILRDFYVDDVLSGGDSREEIQNSQKQLVSLLKRGGFDLRKWSSNNREFLHEIPEKDREIQPCDFDKHGPLKTLGLRWVNSNDTFTYQITMPGRTSDRITKRQFLSDTASIFDPIGWLSP